MNDVSAERRFSDITLLEAAELMRMLDEKSISPAMSEVGSDEIQASAEEVADALLLAIRTYEQRTLGDPAEHLEAVRSDLRRARAA
jgi:hypothetical protein